MGTMVDYSGRKPHSLEMIQFVESQRGYRMWRCVCDCGNEVVLRGSRVASGEQKTCGKCLPHLQVNLGQVFGEWTVVRKKRVNGKPKFDLACSCGNTGEAYASALLNGDSTRCKSCGWGSLYENLPLADMNKVFKYYKRTSQKRNIIWNLDEKEFARLARKNCIYCGRPPSSKFGVGRYQGIDRINSRVGYVGGNCVPCCKICNRAKSSLPVDIWNNWIRDLVKHQNDLQSVS